MSSPMSAPARSWLFVAALGAILVALFLVLFLYHRVSPQDRAAHGGAPVQQHEVSTQVWENLLNSGWHGDPNDDQEALYPPPQTE